MINGNRILAVIPARGGSKRIPRKNIREVAGKPLIYWTIEEAKKSNYIDRLILSSEDEEIIQTAKSLGCDVPFARPVELAADETPGIDPVLHAMHTLPGYQYIVLLQPTSPLRTVSDIDQCIETCQAKRAPACVSVKAIAKSPYWIYKLDDCGHMQPFMNKADCGMPPEWFYMINGAVYVAEVEWLQKEKTFLSAETVAYIMPKERSIDVDTEFDLNICECYLTGNQVKNNEFKK